MDPNTNIQPSRVRPQNPYTQYPRNDPQHDTPAHTRNRPKRFTIPQKTTLYDWIKPKLPENHLNQQNPSLIRDNNNNKPAANDKHTKRPDTRRQHHQQQINPTHTNDQWGDALSSSPATFRIASKNVNTLSPDDNLLQWRGVAHAMRSYQIHSLCIQEPNMKWTAHLQHRVHHIFQQTFLQSALSTSNSTEPSGTYQPGGTALTIVGPHAS